MKEILIKKYDNRRLYCVDTAGYVSLSEIREFIKQGHTVKVIERSTGRDITKYIMMQILLEDRYDLLPLHFFQIMLQYPRENLEDFFRLFFPWTIDAFQNFVRTGYMPPMSGYPNPWGQTPFQNPFFQGMSPFSGAPANKASPDAGFKATQPAEPPPEAPAQRREDETPPKKTDDMNEILNRLKFLEEELRKK